MEDTKEKVLTGTEKEVKASAPKAEEKPAEKKTTDKAAPKADEKKQAEVIKEAVEEKPVKTEKTPAKKPAAKKPAKKADEKKAETEVKVEASEEKTEKAAAPKKPAAKKTAAKKPAAKKPAAKKPAAKKTAAKSAKASDEAAPKAKKPRKKAEKPAAPPEPELPKLRSVLMVSSEAAPFISTGGMGQVAGALPRAMSEADPNLDVRVIMPLYESVKWKYADTLEYIGSTTTYLSWRGLYCGIFTAKVGRVTYYFVDNEYYFKRESCYGYFDDGERFAFFSKAVLSVMEYLDFYPNIVHCNDWQTALVPIYIKTRYQHQFWSVKTMLTLHNMEYQGQFPMNCLTDVFDLGESERNIVTYGDCINLLKGAIVCCDSLTTVSPSYASEIQAHSAHGLEPIIRENAYKLTGIINGIDTDLYNPATDKTLPENYDIDSLEKKAASKRALQETFNLPRSPRTPMLCIVSRLVPHKGIDLLTYIMEDLLKYDVQFLILGTGNHEYELYFTELALRYPDKFAINVAYNPEIATKVYAGSDITLMPSLNEPCGLAQMIGCRYGTIPIVRETGGLQDTIKDCRGGDGNGFTFKDYNASILLDTIVQAMDLYNYKQEDWNNLVKAAMNCDFGWDTSAKKYMEVYSGLL